MAPATRSSNPSTPARPRVSTGSDSPTAPSGRRTPHCSKCHRPRAGHPRSGCPYVDASAQSPSSPSTRAALSNATHIAHAADDGLSEELSSLHIVSPTDDSKAVPRTGSTGKRRLSVRFALVPEQTLASLSPTDTHLVEQLLQPGMMTDAVSAADKAAHVLSWRRTLGDAAPLDGPKVHPVEVKVEPPSGDAVPPLSRRMPCTLSTPTASLTTTEPASDRHIGGSAIDMDQTVYLLPGSEAGKAVPLSRSMSIEQRSSFLQQLAYSSCTAPATLLSIPLADLDSVRSDAEKIGFRVRLLPGREDDHKWVVLGTEEEAIELLTEKFLEQERTGARAKGNGGSLTAVAGGVVFGAVATWTGLAFS